MMIDTVISILVGLFNRIIILFPLGNPQLVSNIIYFSGQFRTVMYNASYFLPVNDMLGVMTIILSCELGVFAFKAIRWIASNLSLGFIK